MDRGKQPGVIHTERNFDLKTGTRYEEHECKDCLWRGICGQEEYELSFACSDWTPSVDADDLSDEEQTQYRLAFFDYVQQFEEVS